MSGGYGNDNAQRDQSGATYDYVTVMVAEQMFGLPIERVHDVFIPSAMTTVPLAPREIMGLLNLRGKVVTAISLRRRLGLPDDVRGGDAMAIGIEHGGESYGLLVDGVGEVLRLTQETLEATPVHLDARWGQVARGVHRLEGKLLIVLDVDSVLAFAVGQNAA